MAFGCDNYNKLYKNVIIFSRVKDKQDKLINIKNIKKKSNANAKLNT